VEPRSVTLVVPGRAVPKGRPRFGQGVVYTPEQTKEYEALIRAKVIDAKRKVGMEETETLVGPVEISLMFMMQAPEPATLVIAKEVDPGIRVDGLPDLDNVIKSLFDGMTAIKYGKHRVGGLMYDDRQVVDLRAKFG